MEFNSITIKNYKSIKEPQCIELDKNFITLVGKNGSGKTNILESINECFSIGKSINVEAELLLKLTGYEFKFWNSLISENKHVTIFYEKGQYKPKKIKSDNLIFNVLKYKENIINLKKQFEIAKNKYIDKLNEIIIEDFNINTSGEFVNLFGVENMLGLMKLNLTLENRIDILEQLKKGMDCFLEDEFEENLINIDNYVPIRINPIEKDLKFKFEKFKMNKVLEKFMQIDFEGIENYIEKLNKELKFELKNINNIILKIVNISNEIADIFDKKIIKHQEDSNFFMIEVEKKIKTKCYLLNNENSYYLSNNNILSHDPLLKYFMQFCIEQNILDEKNISNYYENMNEIIDINIAIGEFQKKLNLLLPLFDKEMCKGVEVELKSNGKELTLFLIENNGDRIPFNSTSLGRRWYFNYYLIKSMLKKEDLFLIDEPASFLHPQAQKEILSDLEELSKNGIKVIISTHSPYMISDKKENDIYFVTMDKTRGSICSKIENKITQELSYEIGFTQYNELLLGLGKEHILVEGLRDKICIEAFMDYFKIDKNIYNIVIMGGYNCSHKIMGFYLTNEKSLNILFDKDAEIETQKYKIRKNQYKKIKLADIDIFNVQYVGGKSRDDIEGLFTDNEDQIFFEDVNTKKGKARKIAIGFPDIIKNHGISKETENNFKELFEKMGIL